jgi:hypothetical protein
MVDFVADDLRTPRVKLVMDKEIVAAVAVASSQLCRAVFSHRINFMLGHL